MRDYQLVSADSHLELPPTVWTDRLPSELRDQGPRVVKIDGGGEGWAVGDGAPVPLGLAVTAGLKYSEFRRDGDLYAHNPPGSGDAAQRVEEQKQDGLDGEVLFSSPIVTVLRKMTDPALQNASCTAYNSWLSDYCGEFPEQLFGIALLPFTGIDASIAELRRVAGKPGIRGVQLLKFPSGAEFLSEADDAFWAAADELDMCVVAHHNFGGAADSILVAGARPDAFAMGGNANLEYLTKLMTCDMTLPALPIMTLLQLMLSGTLDRFPKLRFHFAETLIGWMPYWLEQMEDRYDRHRFWAKVDLPRRPTQYIRDHFTFSFMEDHVGVNMRHEIGLDNICWASDFPHSVCDWPWSVETVQRQFKNVPADERLRIQALNVLVQLRVITAEQRDEMSTNSLDNRFPDTVPARGSRRM
jgi:predicted TIM-barrel fold metal-dependent hydrolase